MEPDTSHGLQSRMAQQPVEQSRPIAARRTRNEKQVLRRLECVELGSEIASEQALFSALQKRAEESGLWEPSAVQQFNGPREDQPFNRSSIWLHGTSDLMRSVNLAKAEMQATMNRSNARAFRADDKQADEVFFQARQARDRLRRQQVLKSRARKEERTISFDLS